MRTPESNSPVGYYFALPRLLSSISGGSRLRSEQNALEAHVVGALVHAITFGFAASLMLGGRPAWQQVVLLLPLALVVWIWWSLFFSASALAIKLLRAGWLLRETPDRQAQSLIVGIVTTLLAWQLVAVGSSIAPLAYIWLVAVALNLTAAAVLALMHAEPAR